MANSINTNIAAYFAQLNIGVAANAASSSVARLSSGNRIVKASDDVAALATGTALRTQVSALKAALINVSQGTSLLQIADGGLSQITDILQRQKAIAVQAGSGSLDAASRSFLNQEFQALVAEIDRIASSTNFNGVALLNGGLGTTTILAPDATAAGNYNPTGVTGSTAATAAASTSPIQAFDRTGADFSGTAAAGNLDVTDSTGTLLTTGYDSLNSALYGQFSSFQLTDVIYGTSATLSATINGVVFSGNVSDTDATALLHNGNTYINIGMTAIDLTDANSTQTSQAQINQDFKDTFIERTSTLGGVDFSGTRLAGAVGTTTNGVASSRLYTPNASISDFAYAGNLGADANELSVQVNGKTFLATGIKDALAVATPTIAFQSDDGQTLIVDLTGLDADFTDIRTDAGQQTALINALNIGFSRAGSGLNFAVGSTASDKLVVQLGNASTASLYNGQSLSVSTAQNAADASASLDNASKTATSLRATVGALQSRFNFASANIQTSIQNQDAARGDLLDTDIAAESTSYATSQVKLQAGISVLAQANQQLQSLLKLIG